MYIFVPTYLRFILFTSYSVSQFAINYLFPYSPGIFDPDVPFSTTTVTPLLLSDTVDVMGPDLQDVYDASASSDYALPPAQPDNNSTSTDDFIPFLPAWLPVINYVTVRMLRL